MSSRFARTLNLFRCFRYDLFVTGLLLAGVALQFFLMLQPATTMSICYVYVVVPMAFLWPASRAHLVDRRGRFESTGYFLLHLPVPRGLLMCMLSAIRTIRCNLVLLGLFPLGIALLMHPLLAVDEAPFGLHAPESITHLKGWLLLQFSLFLMCFEEPNLASSPRRRRKPGDSRATVLFLIFFLVPLLVSLANHRVLSSDNAIRLYFGYPMVFFHAAMKPLAVLLAVRILSFLFKTHRVVAGPLYGPAKAGTLKRRLLSFWSSVSSVFLTGFGIVMYYPNRLFLALSDTEDEMIAFGRWTASSGDLLACFCFGMVLGCARGLSALFSLEDTLPLIMAFFGALALLVADSTLSGRGLCVPLFCPIDRRKLLKYKLAQACAGICTGFLLGMLPFAENTSFRWLVWGLGGYPWLLWLSFVDLESRFADASSRNWRTFVRRLAAAGFALVILVLSIAVILSPVWFFYLLPGIFAIRHVMKRYENTELMALHNAAVSRWSGGSH